MIMMNIKTEESGSFFEQTDVSDHLLPFPVKLPTEDDLPCDDGEPMETPRHKDQMNLLIESLNSYWKSDKKYYTGGNMFLHFELSGKKKFRGPDFFLVMDAEDKPRKSWVVWQENMRFPDVIIEIMSDSTKNIDKIDKKELYEQTFRTQEYYLYDPFSQEFKGYRLSGVRYKTVLPDAKKRIFSPVTGLWLVIENDWLRWMTRSGYVLPSNEELFYKERQKVEEEKLKVEKEKLKAEKEKQKAEKEKQRAEKAENHLCETVLKMLKKGMESAMIMEYTGLNLEEIAKLTADSHDILI